jgi:SAM-dependent methyltransferase
MAHRLRDRFIARLIRATTIADRSQRAFDRARSMVVARFAPDGALEHLNDLAYNARTVYAPGTAQFRAALFNWEEEVFARWLPPAPARVLIGGAGGGREAFALAERGYDVVAFEPSASLADALNRRSDALAVRGYQARYEDLPGLQAVPGGPSASSLDALSPFDAAVVGWGSYSHLRTASARARALRNMSGATTGPMIVRLYTAPAWAEQPPTGVRRWLDRVGLRSPTDRFTPYVGFYHLSTADEIREEASEAGLEVAHLSLDDRDGRWPHAVLVRSHTA